MLGHVRGLFFADYPNLSHPPLVIRVLYEVTGFGHQAVIVFFCLAHFPAPLLLRGLLDPQVSWQPDPLHFLYGLGIATLILSYAYLVAEFTEAPTAVVRRRLLLPWVPRAKEAVR